MLVCISMSTPAARALPAASLASTAKPWSTSCSIEAQSLTTKPSKPHSSRRMVRIRYSLAEAGMPLSSWKPAMKVATPASTAASKGGR